MDATGVAAVPGTEAVAAAGLVGVPGMASWRKLEWPRRLERKQMVRPHWLERLGLSG